MEQPLQILLLQNVLVRPHIQKLHQTENNKTSHKEVIQWYFSIAGLSLTVAHRAAPNVRKSSASLYQSKWSTFCHLCYGKSIDPCKATVHEIAGFFPYLRKVEALSIPITQGYCGALNIISSPGESCCLKIWLSNFCFRILRDLAFPGSWSHQHGTSLRYSRVCLILLMSPLSCHQTHIWPQRRVSSWPWP